MTKVFYFGVLPLIFLLSFSVYLVTLNPAFQADDSAETVAACFNLMPQHPSGYPLHTLLGSLVFSFHLGDEAFRLNLLAALLGAIGVVLTAIYLRALIQRSLPEDTAASYGGALLGALILAFSKSYWAQAVTAKGGIYMLQTLFCLGWFHFIGRITGPGSPKGPHRGFLALAGLIGLGLANGWEMTLVMDLAGILSLLTLGKDRWMPDRRWLLSGALLLLIGSSCYLLLPFKPQEGLVWGNNLSWRSFLSFQEHWQDHEQKPLSSLIHWFTPAKEEGISNEDKQLDRVSEHLTNDIGLWTLPLVLLGGIFLYRRQQKTLLSFGLLSSLFLIFTTGFLLYVEDTNLWCIDKFLIPVNLFMAICAGVGGSALWNWAQEKTKGLGLVCGVFLLTFPALSLVTNFSVNDRSSSIEAYESGAGLMRSLKKNAVFLAEGDDDIFPVFYFQKVLHRRPDVTLVPASYFWAPWGGDVLDRMDLAPGWKAPAYDPGSLGKRVGTILDQLIRSNQGRRPVQFSAELDLFDRCYFSHQTQVVKDGSLFPFLKPWGMTLTEDPDPQGKGTALLADLKLAPPSRPQEGGNEILFDGEAQVFFNAAEYGARTGRGDIAKRFYPQALQQTYDPQLSARIWEGWGDYQDRQGQKAPAREAYLHSVFAHPTASAYAKLIRSYFSARQYDAALGAAQQCVRIFPNLTQAQRDLALCQSAVLEASQKARIR